MFWTGLQVISKPSTLHRMTHCVGAFAHRRCLARHRAHRWSGDGAISKSFCAIIRRLAVDWQGLAGALPPPPLHAAVSPRESLSVSWLRHVFRLTSASRPARPRDPLPSQFVCLFHPSLGNPLLHAIASVRSFHMLCRVRVPHSFGASHCRCGCDGDRSDRIMIAEVASRQVQATTQVVAKAVNPGCMCAALCAKQPEPRGWIDTFVEDARRRLSSMPALTSARRSGEGGSRARSECCDRTPLCFFFEPGARAGRGRVDLH